MNQSAFFAVLALLPVSALLSQSPISYGTGAWSRATLGNDRAVVRVTTNADAVWAHLPWRRRDQDPSSKQIIVIDGATGKPIANVARVDINRESGDLVFQPVSGPGEYQIYFLPYSNTGRENYPKAVYSPAQATADPSWLGDHHLQTPQEATAHRSEIPDAEVVAFQSVDDFDRFTSMELIATQREVSRLLAQYPASAYFIFPEDRSNSIRMTRDLPAAWAQRGPATPLFGSAARGEFYSFQLGVWAARASLKNLRVQFADLTSPKTAIPASAFRCFNLSGVNWEGKPFNRTVNVEQGKVKALWCGVQIPADAAAGDYHAAIQVFADKQAPTPIEFRLNVTPESIRNAGDDDPQRLSRLRWLDSKLAEDDGIVRPYTPVQLKDQTLSILGRDVSLNAGGFPKSIRSHFSIEMTGYATHPREVLSAPIRLVVGDANSHDFSWSASHVRFVKQTEGAVAWEVSGHSGPLTTYLRGEMEFDGTIDYSIDLTARKASTVSDIRLEIPIVADVAHYAMGLGLRGGTRPDQYDWKWRVEHNQDGAWIGDVNAGLQFSLRDDRYSRPLNTNFYLSKPLVMPASWDNAGKGGCRLGVKDSGTYLVTCYSGARSFAAGETQHYNLRLLLTPFHTLDTKSQWHNRFYHAYKPLAEIAATGANTVNVHHATADQPLHQLSISAPE